VAGIDDEFLDEHPVVAERGFGLGFRQPKAFGDFARRMRDPHPLPPPPAEAFIMTG